MSKFAGLFDGPQKREKGTASRKRQAQKPKARRETSEKRRGRPAGSAGGKRSDPAFVAITAYVRRDTLGEVKAKLEREKARAPEGAQDLSDVVQRALAEYLKI